MVWPPVRVTVYAYGSGASVSRGPSNRILALVVRVCAPALAALALVIVVANEASEADHDLRLIVPRAASAGELLPVRGLLYSGLRAVEGPQLAPRDVEVQLIASGGRVLSHTRLTHARSGTNDIEGTLPVPAAALGDAFVHAQVRVGREDLSVDAPLQLVASAEGEPAEPRALRELQQLSESGVQRMPLAPPPPDALHVRVAGGVCVPEQPCRVFVHVGEPAAAVLIETTPSVTPDAQAEEPSAETSGALAFDVVTHGPEAQLWLRASRSGRTVARRAIRLPIALGGATLSPRAVLLDAPATPEIALAGEAEGFIVDVLRLHAASHYQWVRTGSLAQSSEPQAVPFAALSAGIYRVQARRDPFSASNAAARVVYVRTPGEPPAQVLRTLAEAARTIDPGDLFVTRVRNASGAVDESSFPAALGYLAAIVENGVVVQPAAATGFAAARARLTEAQTRMRWLALIALALGGVALALSVGKRGLEAGDRISELLVSAGQDAATARRAHLRSRLATIASALALLLVFVVVALYVIARGNALH